MILLERRHNYVRQPSDIGGVSGSDAFWIEDVGRKHFTLFTPLCFLPLPMVLKDSLVHLCALGSCQ